jgi:putative ATP-binding cassette transporter
MKLLVYILKQSAATVCICAITSAISGAAFALLIALVHRVLTQAQPPQNAVALFLGLVTLALISGMVAQWQTAKLAQATRAKLADHLARSMLATPLQQLEHLGESQLMAALTAEIHALVSAISGLPQIMINLSIVAVGVVYLLMLSPLGFLTVCSFMIVGMGAYALLLRKANRPVQQAQQRQLELFESFQGISAGAKELKLNGPRRYDFLQQILQARLHQLQHANMQAERYFVFANTAARFIFFALVGLLVFLLPNLQPLSNETLLGYSLFVFYFMGPLSIIMGQVQTFAKANAALKSLDQMQLNLAHPIHSDPPKWRTIPWQSLQIQNLTHQYTSDSSDDHFQLGPIDLNLERGKVYFIVGGNGSGKTTLLKLISGLYLADQGNIQLGEQPITAENLDNYRQHFTGVYGDFYLFEQLLGIRASDRDQRAQAYLEKLKINHKVSIQDGTFSTLALSTGQRKRLALVVAYLEDRDIYFFDEWAADQDPEFKRVFYRELIPELKARGKTLLIISHDDRYFDLADEVIKLETGQIRRD